MPAGDQHAHAGLLLRDHAGPDAAAAGHDAGFDAAAARRDHAGPDAAAGRDDDGAVPRRRDDDPHAGAVPLLLRHARGTATSAQGGVIDGSKIGLCGDKIVGFFKNLLLNLTGFAAKYILLFIKSLAISSFIVIGGGSLLLPLNILELTKESSLTVIFIIYYKYIFYFKLLVVFDGLRVFQYERNNQQLNKVKLFQYLWGFYLMHNLK